MTRDGARRPVRLDDPSDPAFDDYRDLRRGGRAHAGREGTRARREADTTHVVVEGHLALSRALQGPLRFRSVLLTPARAESLSDLVDGLPTEVEVLLAPRDVLARVCGFDVHRGVLASAARPAAVAPSQLLASCRRLVSLEGLTDLENVGAVFRVAAGLGLDGVLLDGRCADPLYRRCVRVSLGWSTIIPHARCPAGLAPLEAASAAGVTTVALTPDADATPVDAAAREGLLDDPVALLVGAEGSGLDDETIRGADHRVRIPMARGADSLNAATALAVVGAFAAASRGWS